MKEDVYCGLNIRKPKGIGNHFAPKVYYLNVKFWGDNFASAKKDGRTLSRCTPARKGFLKLFASEGGLRFGSQYS